jgi:hypothetical protein
MQNFLGALRVPDFVGDSIAIEQAKRQNALVSRDADVRYQNALAQQEQLGWQREDRRRLNALRSNPNATPEDYIRAGQPQTGNALGESSRQRKLDDMGVLYRAAQQVESAQDPLGTVKLLMASPDVSAVFQRHGIDPASLQLGDPEQIKAGARRMRTQFGPFLEKSPAAEGFSLPPGHIRYDAAGNIVATAPRAPERREFGQTPHDGINPQTGKPDQYVLDEFGNPKWLGIADAPKQPDQNDLQRFRKEFRGLQSVKDYESTLPLLVSARKAPDTPQGDLQVIYTVGKILDPGSVVREGELQLTQNAAPFVQQIAGKIRAELQSKGRLTQATREGLLDMLNQRVMGYRQAYDRDYQEYARLGDEGGFAPRDVVGRHAANAYQPQGPARISSDEEYDQLPSGSVFVGPDGQQRRKP